MDKQENTNIINKSNESNESNDSNQFNNKSVTNYQNNELTPDYIAKKINKIPSSYNQEVYLYVRYDEKGWFKFELTDYNKHQLVALNEFIDSNELTKQIIVPHSVYGYFVGFFEKSVSEDIMYNDVYSYRRDFDYDKNKVSFVSAYPSQIGFVNRTTT